MAAEIVAALRIVLWVYCSCAPAVVALAVNTERLLFRSHAAHSSKATAWLVLLAILLMAMDVGGIAAALMENVDSALGDVVFNTSLYFAAAAPLALLVWSATAYPDTSKYQIDWLGLILGLLSTLIASGLNWVASDIGTLGNYTPPGIYVASVVAIVFIVLIRAADNVAEPPSAVVVETSPTPTSYPTKAHARPKASVAAPRRYPTKAVAVPAPTLYPTLRSVAVSTPPTGLTQA